MGPGGLSAKLQSGITPVLQLPERVRSEMNRTDAYQPELSLPTSQEDRARTWRGTRAIHFPAGDISLPASYMGKTNLQLGTP